MDRRREKASSPEPFPVPPAVFPGSVVPGMDAAHMVQWVDETLTAVPPLSMASCGEMPETDEGNSAVVEGGSMDETLQM
jgi:hypothetical protein